jgi:putative flippase GtrA
MIKKVTKILWAHRVQFSKYFIVGISAVFLDMASLIVFKEYLGIAPVVAVIINQILLIFYVFFLNKHWSFQEKGGTRGQMVRFFIIVGFNYCFSVSAMYIFNHLLNFDYRLVRLASIILAVSWNFFLYKYWVYASPLPLAVPAEVADNPIDTSAQI